MKHKNRENHELGLQKTSIHRLTLAAFIHYQLKTLSHQLHGDKRLNILLPVPLSLGAKSFCNWSLITLKEVHQLYKVTNKKIYIFLGVKLVYRLNSKQLSLLQLYESQVNHFFKGIHSAK